MTRDFLLKLNDTYYDEGEEKCFELFNQLSEDDKKKTLKQALKQFDARYFTEETKEDRLFYGSCCEDIIFILYDKETFFNEEVEKYISRRHFVEFEFISSSFFKKIRLKRKRNFIKLLKTRGSRDLLFNHLHFKFNKNHIKAICEVIDKDIRISDLNDRKVLFNKIGLFPNFLEIEFSKNTKEKEFMFYMDNLHHLEEVEVMKTFNTNFIKGSINTVELSDISNFRVDFFLRFYEKRPEIYHKLKEMYDKQEKPFSLMTGKLAEPIKKIFELMNNAVNIKDF